MPENQFDVSNLALFQHTKLLGVGQQKISFSLLWRLQTYMYINSAIADLFLPFSRAVCLTDPQMAVVMDQFSHLQSELAC